MKKIIIIIAIFCLNQKIIPQNKSENSINKNIVFSFENADIIPLFKGCKPKKKIEKEKKCVKKGIMNFIYKNFDNSIVSELGLWTGTYAIDGRFIIKKNGKVSNIKVKSETPELKNEMERVLNLMPDFIRPGQVDGNNVEIEYDLPFKIFVQ